MTREFDCVECGRHIFRYFHREGEPLLCLECVYLPGWFEDEGLRAILDPAMEVPPNGSQK